MKIKSLFTLIWGLSLVFTLTVVAQEEKPEEPKYGWQKEMVSGLNITQTSFDNWAAGGENSFAWQVNLNAKFVNDQEKSNWANSAKLTYGSTKAGEQSARKSIDEIKLETVYTHKFAKYLNPFVAGTAETQIAPGYKYAEDAPKTEISAFMDPAYFRESVGLGYIHSEAFKTRLGASMKQTVTDQYAEIYADGDDFRNEIGAESVTDLSLKVSENSLIKSKLELFSTFKTFDKTDVNWDNVFTTKISEYFNVNVNFKLLYDKDISPKRQIKQSIALGLTYTFI